MADVVKKKTKIEMQFRDDEKNVSFYTSSDGKLHLSYLFEQQQKNPCSNFI